MSEPLVTIITPTFNRPFMFAECAAAVLAQRFTDWVWYVVLNCEKWPEGYDLLDISKDPRVMTLWYSVPEVYRKRFHIPSQIVNWLYPKVQTPYIYWLSDDDLIDPDGLGVLTRAAKYPPESDAQKDMIGYDAVYGRCEVVDQQPDGSYKHACWCYEHGDVGGDTGIDPHCLLDGGQVLHTADLWRRATADGWRLPDTKDAAANDGVLLARLAEFARFHYVPQRIVTHRRHAGATHHKPQEDK